MTKKESNQEVFDVFADDKAQEEQEELRQINDNLSFNARSLNSITTHLVENLSVSQVTIQKILDAMQTSLNQQESIVSKMNDESRVLCLIPQKMQDRIDMIAPKIATEIGIIHNSKIVELNNQFNILQDKLTKDFDVYGQKLETTTTQCLEQLINTTDSIKATIEQKLAQFTKQLSVEADVVSSQNSIRFLRNLTFIVLFSGLVSASASYLVATQFPRYVRVDAPNNLSIIDSKVQIWEAKSQDKQDKKVENVKLK
jgi:hypothetical protein